MVDKKKLDNQSENKYEDYGSKFMYKFSDIISEYLHKIPFMSPNLITTTRNLILIHLIYKMVYKKEYTNLGVNIFFIGLLDCVDGEYARKYNMVTSFGDKYDHISDTITTIVLFVLLYKYSDSRLNFIIAIIFIILCIQQYMCLERYRIKYLNIDTGRDSTEILNSLCPVKTKKGLENFLSKYRFLGYSTYYMIMAVLFSKIK